MKKILFALLLFVLSASSVFAVVSQDPNDRFVKQSELKALEIRVVELERLNRSLEERVRLIESRQQIANFGASDFLPFELQFEQMKIRQADQEMRINTLQIIVYQIRDRVILALDTTINLLKKLIK